MMTNPNDILAQYMRLYPHTGKIINAVLNDRGKEIPDWPKWCFVPMAAFFAIVSAKHGENFGLNHVKDVAILSALATWRYSKGIYSIHPELQTSLTSSTIFGDLPTGVFRRLPEWCIYVETPGLLWAERDLHGFFAHMEWDANTHREELRILLNTDNELMPAILHVGEWTIEEAIRRWVEESIRQAKNAGHSEYVKSLQNERELFIEIMSEEMASIVSLLLYICSDEPEIDDRVPGHNKYPKQVKTKKGFRLFPADKPRMIRIGEKVGEKLRIQRLASHVTSVKKGKSKRAHLRRGHWHGYWTGPKDGERTFIYRWLPPQIVGGSKE